MRFKNGMLDLPSSELLAKGQEVDLIRGFRSRSRKRRNHHRYSDGKAVGSGRVERNIANGVKR